MSLKVTTSPKTGETRFFWTSDDETSEATWKLKAEAKEEEILEIMIKVVRFVRAQHAEKEGAIEEVKTFLMNDLADMEVLAPGNSPADRPSDGGPPAPIGWAALARGSTPPPIPASSAANGWEYIPADEL
jgi:hypothetical protein